MDSETNKGLENCFQAFVLFGAPGEIRTPDPLVRSQVLYPTELRARNARTRIMRRPRKTVNFRVIQKTGGERGIRTLDGDLKPHTPLAGERLQPLGHLSGECPLPNITRISRIAPEIAGVKPRTRLKRQAARCCQERRRRPARA